MRYVAVLLVSGFVAACAPPEAPDTDLPSARALLDMATRTARVDGRVVLVKFRASWCEWCARLDEALHSFELGRTMSDNYVLLDMTVEESEDKLALETPGGAEFREEMGGAGSGIPYYVFLDTNGEKLADSNIMPGGTNIGYPVTAEEIAAFEGLLRRTAPRMTDADLDRVSEYLVAHTP